MNIPCIAPIGLEAIQPAMPNAFYPPPIPPIAPPINPCAFASSSIHPDAPAGAFTGVLIYEIVKDRSEVEEPVLAAPRHKFILYNDP